MTALTVVIIAVAAALVAGFIAFICGFFYRKSVSEKQIGSANDEARRIINEAIKTADTKKKEAILEAKEQLHKERTEQEREIKERRVEVTRQEKRLQQREETLDRKYDNLDRKEEQLNAKLKKAEELRVRLSKIARVKVDDSENSAGWKFAEYEMKGVPVRLEIGPKDIENNQCVLVTRHNREKHVVSLDELETAVPALLREVHDGLYQKALENRERHTYACRDMDEIIRVLAEQGDGFVKAMWCGDEACEDAVKEKTGVGSRCIPFEQEHLADTCVCCGKPATKMVYWGKAY